MDIDANMTVLFTRIYNTHKAKGVVLIPDWIVAQICVLNVYNRLVIYEIIEPIENLALEEKQSLVDECRQVQGVKYTNRTLRNTCRILHVIKFYNKKGSVKI